MIDASRFLVSVRCRPGPSPNPASCARVRRVAPSGPAGRAGVRAGALLVSALGREGFEFDDQRILPILAEYPVVFWQDGGTIEVRIRRADLGLELCPTFEGAMRETADHDQLLAAAMFLWEERRWPELAQVTKAGILEQSTVAQRMLSRLWLPRPNTPLLLLHGAALLEMNDPTGQRYLREFESKYAWGWTSEYHAILAYYAAKADPTPATIARLAHDTAHYTSARIEALREHLSASAELNAAPVYFPIDYDFAPIGGGPRLRLGESLSSLASGQLLVVCALGRYRANGPYHDFVQRFFTYAAALPEVLRGLHVVTEEVEASEWAQGWLGGERAAVAAHLPIRVGYDPDGALVEALGSVGSPDILVLDGEGAILHRGCLTSLDWWTVVGALP